MHNAPQPEGEVFGRRLRELREQRGQTQRSLAELTGMSHVHICHLEQGLKIPSLTTLVRLAVALRCEVGDLVDAFSGRNLRSLLP